MSGTAELIKALKLHEDHVMVLLHNYKANANEFCRAMIEIRSAVGRYEAAVTDEQKDKISGEVDFALAELEAQIAAFSKFEREIVARSSFRHLEHEAIRMLEAYNAKAVDFKNNPEVRAKVRALTDGRCAYCDIELAPEGSPKGPATFCIEHVVPVSYGGPDNIQNYVPACLSCNNSKGDRHVLTLIRKVRDRPNLRLVQENLPERYGEEVGT